MKFDKEKWGERISPILSIWKVIYNEDSIDSIQRSIGKIQSKDPINIFIKSETMQIIDLAKTVDTTLTNISLALFSNGVITSTIMKNCLSLLQNKIPDEWVSLWDGPELPANYVKSLGKKIFGLTNYAKNALNDTVLDINISLSELLHPEAFINALRQKTARKLKIPIDEMEICCDFNSKLTKNEMTFAKISGLFLQGADFDGKKLVDITGNKSEIVGLPLMNLYWIDQKNRQSDESRLVYIILMF